VNARFQVPLRVAAVTAATAVVGVMATLPAAAAGNGDVHVVNTETVQTYTSPTGKVQTSRVYEQVALTGNGTVKLSNPISTDSLRNLDGFAAPKVRDGRQIIETSVNGEKKLRTVSEFTGKLPLDVSVAYKLNGKNVEPGDVVGADGRLEVTYTVKNVTAEPQQLTFDNGTGGTITKTVQVPIPIVGSLDITAPPSFTNVRSGAANMAGDGKGGTKLSFTMTLFPPIATDTAVLGYTADIKDGVIPRAEISALPVNPMQSPTFKSAGGSYHGGAESGVDLATGATTIDTNLLKIRDGAGELLAGLIKLRDGAQQLQTGLAGQAAPGADKLAAGAGQLDDGLGQINSGSKRLAAGTGEAAAGSQKLAAGTQQLKGGVSQLSGGADQLDAGARRLAKGQKDLAGGLKTLYDGVAALPESVQAELAKNFDYQSALFALDSIAAGIGQVGDAPSAKTLLGGLNAIQYGMRFPAAPDCNVALAGGTPTKCGAMDAVQLVAGRLAGSGTTLDQSAAAILTGTYQKVDRDLLGTGLPAGSLGGLDQLRFGLSNPNADPAKCAAGKFTETTADDCGIKQVALALRAGVPVLVDTLTANISQELLAGIGQPTKGCDPTKTLRCGSAALVDGSRQLSDGIGQLVAGVAQLNAGGVALADGAGQLSAGLGKLDAGANKLANGIGQAKDGSGQLAAGAQKLAVGLGDAANGSGRLAEGLGKAAAGAPKLVDGAQRLSDEGTKKLVGAGKDTAQNYGELFATFKAGAQRASTEDMAYGAPQGAMGLTAYSYVIQGEDGEGGRNWARGVAGLGLLGAGAGAFALRRRFV
jgi:putative membrane protein